MKRGHRGSRVRLWIPLVLLLWSLALGWYHWYTGNVDMLRVDSAAAGAFLVMLVGAVVVAWCL